MRDVVVQASIAELHDHLEGQAGSHAVALAQLGQPGPHVVHTDVRRANVRDLAGLARWLIARRDRISTWRLRWASQSQRPGLAPTRLGLAVPHMLHAATKARHRGLETQLVAVPTCVVGPHAALRAAEPPGQGGHFPEVCTGCTARAQCCGVAPEYAARFAVDLELKRLTASPRS